MVDKCCGSCDEYDRTVVDFKTDGLGKKSGKNSSRFLLESLDTSTDFTFPVHGNSLQDSYKGGYGYVPVIESSGVAFIVNPNVRDTQSTMFASVISCLPVLLLPMVTASAAGIIIWILVSVVCLVFCHVLQMTSNLPGVVLQSFNGVFTHVTGSHLGLLIHKNELDIEVKPGVLVL